MMMRVEFLIPDADIGFYTFGQYIEQYRAYKYIHNFKTKGILFEDVEKEIKAYQQAHRKVDSIYSL